MNNYLITLYFTSLNTQPALYIITLSEDQKILVSSRVKIVELIIEMGSKQETV